jgi:hypothetical protein
MGPIALLLSKRWVLTANGIAEWLPEDSTPHIEFTCRNKQEVIREFYLMQKREFASYDLANQSDDELIKELEINKPILKWIRENYRRLSGE